MLIVLSYKAHSRRISACKKRQNFVQPLKSYSKFPWIWTQVWTCSNPKITDKSSPMISFTSRSSSSLAAYSPNPAIDIRNWHGKKIAQERKTKHDQVDETWIQRQKNFCGSGSCDYVKASTKDTVFLQTTPTPEDFSLCLWANISGHRCKPDI